MDLCSNAAGHMRLMAKVVPERPREVIRKLRIMGFEGPFGGGKHLVMRHREHGLKITVPGHGGRDIPVGTMRAIIRAAGSAPEVWSRL